MPEAPTQSHWSTPSCLLFFLFSFLFLVLPQKSARFFSFSFSSGGCAAQSTGRWPEQVRAAGMAACGSELTHCCHGPAALAWRAARPAVHPRCSGFGAPAGAPAGRAVLLLLSSCFHCVCLCLCFCTHTHTHTPSLSFLSSLSLFSLFSSSSCFSFSSSSILSPCDRIIKACQLILSLLQSSWAARASAQPASPPTSSARPSAPG